MSIKLERKASKKKVHFVTFVWKGKHYFEEKCKYVGNDCFVVVFIFCCTSVHIFIWATVI